MIIFLQWLATITIPRGISKISCGASLRMKHRPKRNWGGLCCNVYDWKWQGLGLEKMSDSRLSFKGNAIRIYPFTNRKEVSPMMFDWTTLSLTVTKTHRYVYHETRTWGPSRGDNIYMYSRVTFSHIYIYTYRSRNFSNTAIKLHSGILTQPYHRWTGLWALNRDFTFAPCTKASSDLRWSYSNCF